MVGPEFFVSTVELAVNLEGVANNKDGSSALLLPPGRRFYELGTVDGPFSYGPSRFRPVAPESQPDENDDDQQEPVICE